MFRVTANHALQRPASARLNLVVFKYQNKRKNIFYFLFSDYPLEMASERWAVRQYQYSYYPYDPYYSYSHAYAWNCSYFATTTYSSAEILSEVY